MDGLLDKVLAYKGVMITVETLREMSAAANYMEFYAMVQALVEQSILRQVGGKKDTNGMVPPLQSRYRITRPEKDIPGESEEIMLLSPRLNLSGYLKDRERYRKERDILIPLSTFLKSSQEALQSPMSKNERAYSIWKNEKALDDSRYQSVMRYNEAEGLLNFYRTPEPFFEYLCPVEKPRTILILENKDIWYTLRKLLILHPEKRRLFGLLLDGIIYGEGKKASRPKALEEYAALSGLTPEFWYCGDIDYEGFSIYDGVCQANPGLTIRLFSAGYHAMVEQGSDIRHCPKKQERPNRLEEILQDCDPQDRERLCELLDHGYYIPQECLNYPYLMEVMEP